MVYLWQIIPNPLSKGIASGLRFLTILCLIYGCYQQEATEPNYPVPNTNQSVEVEKNGGYEDEMAETPSNITGAFLTCDPMNASGLKYGCNVNVRESGRDRKARISNWANQIKWSHQSDRQVVVDQNSPGYHVTYTFDQATSAQKSKVKLELNGITSASAPSDYVITSPILNLRNGAQSSGGDLQPEAVDVFIEPDDTFSHKRMSPASRKVVMPAINDYRNVDGCYIACYTNNHTRWVYRISADMGVVGLTRVQGFYEAGGNICRPRGFETADISALNGFKDLCAATHPLCSHRSCWAGGSTREFIYK